MRATVRAAIVLGMKPILRPAVLLSVLVLASLSPGCRGVRIHESEERITKLENRVTALEAKVDMLTKK